MAAIHVPPVSQLADELYLVIAQLVRRLRAEGAQHELSWSQLSAMAHLETGGPTTIAALARVEAVKPQSMGAVVATLERGGFVKRSPHPTDGRQIVFSLTRAGRKVRIDGARAKRRWLAATVAEKINRAERHRLQEAIQLLHRLIRAEQGH